MQRGGEGEAAAGKFIQSCALRFSYQGHCTVSSFCGPSDLPQIAATMCQKLWSLSTPCLHSDGETSRTASGRIRLLYVLILNSSGGILRSTPTTYAESRPTSAWVSSAVDCPWSSTVFDSYSFCSLRQNKPVHLKLKQFKRH